MSFNHLKIFHFGDGFVISFCDDVSCVHENDSVGKVREFGGVRGHYYRFAFQRLPNGLPQNVLSHVHVDGAEDVVEEVNVALRVKRPRQTDARLLSARKIDAVLSDRCLHSVGQYPNVFHQTRSLQRPLQTPFVHLWGKGDVVLKRFAHHPRPLRHVSHTPAYLHHSITTLLHLV